MAKKFICLCLGIMLLWALCVPNMALCSDYFNQSNDPREIRIRSGSRTRRNSWAAYMGDLKLSEEEFFYTVGKLDWAAKARETHNDSRSAYQLGGFLLCSALIWHLYSEQKDIESWEDYDEQRRAARFTFGLSVLGSSIILFNWIVRPDNSAPKDVAVKAAEGYNQQLFSE